MTCKSHHHYFFVAAHLILRISRLSVKSLGGGGRGGHQSEEEEEEEDEMDSGNTHPGSRCFKRRHVPLLLAKFYKKYPEFPCIQCRLSWSSVPKWKFTKNFEWRSSGSGASTYDRRLVSVGNVLSAEELFSGQARQVTAYSGFSFLF